jgi:hypothetical protein
MGAFLSKGEFSGKWLKKKPPLAGEVSRIGTEGSLYLGGKNDSQSEDHEMDSRLRGNDGQDKVSIST